MPAQHPLKRDDDDCDRIHHLLPRLDHLPTAVLRRILGFAGFVRPGGCPVWLAYEGGRVEETAGLLTQTARHKRWEDGILGCCCPAFPVAIMTTCRAVHDAATDVLYGSNAFALDWPQDAAEVGVLSPRALASLRILHVVVRRNDPKKPMEAHAYAGAYRKHFGSLCDFLSTRCTPGRLNLTLATDLGPEPLTTLNALTAVGGGVVWPKVLACSVRISTPTPPTPASNSLATRLANLLSRGDAADAPFPMAALPDGVQRQILALAGLAGPPRSSCTPSAPSLIFQNGRLDRTRTVPAPPPALAAPAARQSSPPPPAQKPYPPATPSRSGSASRALRDAAYAVAFSENILVLSGRSDLSHQLLENIGPEARHAVRTLELRLHHHRPFHRGRPPGLTSTEQNWEAMIEFLASPDAGFDLGRMTVVLDAWGGVKNDEFLGQDFANEFFDVKRWMALHVRPCIEGVVEPIRRMLLPCGLASFRVLWSGEEPLDV
ncbi:hypothetical protein DFJ73DRAFT_939452 [Zopfochytrium polystomum]|nr:hypothetical protein DFJ73DRAFT_939452 [Zopfochytrium polystomum]